MSRGDRSQSVLPVYQDHAHHDRHGREPENKDYTAVGHQEHSAGHQEPRDDQQGEPLLEFIDLPVFGPDARTLPGVHRQQIEPAESIGDAVEGTAARATGPLDLLIRGDLDRL